MIKNCSQFKGQQILNTLASLIKTQTLIKYMHQPNTNSNAEISPYYFSSAESTTCRLLPTLADELFVLVVGVDLQYLLEGADLLRDTALSSGSQG